MNIALSSTQMNILKPIIGFCFREPFGLDSHGNIMMFKTGYRYSFLDLVLDFIPKFITGGSEPEALDLAEEFLYHVIYDNQDDLINSVRDAFLEKYAVDLAEYQEDIKHEKPSSLTETKEEFDAKAKEDTDILMAAFGSTKSVFESDEPLEEGPYETRDTKEPYELPELKERPKEEAPKNPWGEVEES